MGSPARTTKGFVCSGMLKGSLSIPEQNDPFAILAYDPFSILSGGCSRHVLQAVELPPLLGVIDPRQQGSIPATE